MLIAAEKLALADNAFAARQVNAAVGAAHHILATLALRRLVALQAAAITLDDPVNNPDAQGKK